MIAVDTNILIYASRSEHVWYSPAAAAIRQLAETTAWAIPWPCLSEFFNVVTHPRRYKPPTPPARAIQQIENWLESPYLTLISETTTKIAWATFRDTLVTSRVVGPMVHDARIAAICLQHGVEELWSVDRDFSRYPQLLVRNPLIAVRANEPRGRYKLSAAALRKPVPRR